LNWLLKEVSYNGSFKGVIIGHSYKIIHLLFVDDILILYEGTRRVVENFKVITYLFYKAT